MLEFEEKLAKSWDPAPRWRDLTVVVAVSGGPDSVALLRSLVSLGSDSQTVFVVAHFNHGWRGHQSDNDQRFVEQLGQQLGLRCEVGAPAKSIHSGPHSEEAARKDRHRFLGEVGRAVGARYVATGHTADDQAETVLHRIIRGTGLAGLAGIPRTRALDAGLTLMHPLLCVRRCDVLAYLRELGQDYREDATNTEPRYTRNRIRCELLPSLAADYNPQVAEALLRLATLADEAQSLLEPMAEQLYVRSLPARDSQGVTLQLSSLQAAPRYLVCEMLIAIWKEFGWPLAQMSYEKWDQLATLTKEGPVDDKRRVTMPGCVYAQRSSSMLRIWRESD